MYLQLFCHFTFLSLPIWTEFLSNFVRSDKVKLIFYLGQGMACNFECLQNATAIF